MFPDCQIRSQKITMRVVNSIQLILVMTESFWLLAEPEHLRFVSLFYRSHATTLKAAYQTYIRNDTHKKEKDRHFSYPLNAFLDLLHGSQVGGHLEDTKWNTTHGYDPWCHQQKYITLVVKLLCYSPQNLRQYMPWYPQEWLPPKPLSESGL